MAKNTKIEWATHTFNPWQGCTEISPACDNCYAKAFAKRSGQVKWGAGEPRRRTTATNWKLPIKWNKQAESDSTRPRVFCASLADVFDSEVPDSWRSDLWALIAATPNLDWLLVTKRIGNAKRMLPDGFRAETYPNIWLGVTVCNQEEADRDIPKLLGIDSVIRFLSVEPMLGEIKLPVFCGCGCGKLSEIAREEVIDDPGYLNTYQALASMKRTLGIDWVIAGGESGPNARPMNLKWLRKLQLQCEKSGTAFFFKQWGEYVGGYGARGSFVYLQNGQNTVTDKSTHYWGGDIISQRVGKKHAGRELDGQDYNEYPRVRHD